MFCRLIIQPHCFTPSYVSIYILYNILYLFQCFKFMSKEEIVYFLVIYFSDEAKFVNVTVILVLGLDFCVCSM